jgi:hypothetical protein
LIEIDEFRKTCEPKLIDLDINIEELKASSISKAYQSDLGVYLDHEKHSRLVKIKKHFDMKSTHTQLTELARKFFTEKELMSPDSSGNLNIHWFDNSSYKSP